jgi:hypothetical protein
MVLSRTLLWKYFDKETCIHLHGGQRKAWACKHKTAEADCAKALARASWLPSFDEWEPKLGLPVTDDRGGIGNLHRRPPSYPSTELPPFNDSFQVLATSEPKFMFNMSRLETEGYLLTKGSLSVAEKLFSNGSLFLHGMLFHEVFPIAAGASPVTTNIGHAENSPRNASSESWSYALHSRHWLEPSKQEGISRESWCLKLLLDEKKNLSGRICHVYMMSDREETIVELEQYLRDHNCTPIVANHERGGSFRHEHGPFAGIGFFQDLMVARRARSGLIGNLARSSTQLLWELIEYDCFVDHARLYGALAHHQPAEFVVCLLPDKKLHVEQNNVTSK